MPRRKTTIQVIAGAQSVEQIASALSLLAFLSDPKFQKVAKANLETLDTATQANTKALKGLQGRLVEVDAEAKADRAEAAKELADAKIEAARLVEEGRLEGNRRVEVLNTRDGDLAAREGVLKNGQEALEKREAEFARETSRLRGVLQ